MRWRFCLALLFCVGLTFTLAAEGGATAGDSVDGEEDEAKVEEEVDAGKTASEGGVTKDKVVCNSKPLLTPAVTLTKYLGFG